MVVAGEAVVEAVHTHVHAHGGVGDHTGVVGDHGRHHGRVQRGLDNVVVVVLRAVPDNIDRRGRNCGDVGDMGG